MHCLKTVGFGSKVPERFPLHQQKRTPID
jgi:hypothetical protein